MTKSTKIIIGVIILIIVIGGIWYAVSRKPSGEEQEPIKVGVILPLSGSAAYYGNASKNGIEIAKEEIMKEYPQLNLQIYYEDSYYTPKGGVDSYSKLRNINQIDGVITAASHVSLAVQPLSTKDGILQMAIFSSADKYTTPNDLSFRISTRNEIEAARIAEFIKKEGFEKLGIIYLNNDFGLGFKDSLKEKLKEKKALAQIVGEEGVLLDASDFRTSLLKIKEADVIFMVGIAKHYGLIMKQAREMGISIPFISMRSAEDPVLLVTAGDVADGLIYSYPFDASSEKGGVNKFTNLFKEKYGENPDAYAAEGYEGFKLIALSFNECGKNYECIKEYLENLKNYKSVFGDLSFDKNGDVYYNFFLKTIKNGQFVPYEE